MPHVRICAGGGPKGPSLPRPVLSVTAKIRHGVAVEHLGSGVKHYEAVYNSGFNALHHDSYEEFLREDCVTPVPDQVAFRIDWPAFVGSLSERDRELMNFLGMGNTNRDAAEEFNISPGRVSQLRAAWMEEWRRR